jgi:MFS transporter
MAFLRNRAVNWLNFHGGIRSLAEGMGALFILIYLLRAGFSIPASLCSIAAILAGRFVIRPTTLPLARRFGLRTVFIAGDLIMALEYVMLGRVHGVDESLLAYVLVASVGGTLYWTSQHAYYAAVGDSEHRGHQISAGQALGTLVGIVAPLIGAWLLASFGPRIAAATVGAVQALAVLPLLALPEVHVPEHAPGAFRASLPGMWLFMADGWFAASFQLLWQIALYLSLGSNLAAYGGAMALAALVGAVSGLLLGRHIDAGHWRHGVAITFSLISVTLLLRVLSVDTPWLAVTANAVSAVAFCLLAPVQMVPVYNLAKLSPCTLRFHIAAEGGWDVGGSVGCLTAAGLFALGVPLGPLMLMGFTGVAWLVLALSHYYRLLGTSQARVA